jgi:acyl-coenzyme A synthetase/AMP-(fatty) acid ligase
MMQHDGHASLWPPYSAGDRGKTRKIQDAKRVAVVEELPRNAMGKVQKEYLARYLFEDLSKQ